MGLVLKRTRERGRDYFAARRATVVKGNAWRVDATVQGSRSYDVKLSREQDEIEAWCTCPYCGDYFEPCKHIWATLLAAEAEGYLEGDSGRSARHLTLVAPDSADDPEDEEWYEAPRPFSAFRPRNGIAHSKPRSRQPRQTTRPWKEALSRLHSTTEQTPAIRATALPPGHELVYVVDTEASLMGNGLVLEVATRNRKRDGEWSKPKGRRFALSEIAHLPEPADRQAMAIRPWRCANR